MLHIVAVALAAAAGAYLGFAVAAWQWERRRRQGERDAYWREHTRGQPEAMRELTQKQAEDEAAAATRCDCPIPRDLQERLLRDGGIIAPRPRRTH